MARLVIAKEVKQPLFKIFEIPLSLILRLLKGFSFTDLAIEFLLCRNLDYYFLALVSVPSPRWTIYLGGDQCTVFSVIFYVAEAAILRKNSYVLMCILLNDQEAAVQLIGKIRVPGEEGRYFWQE